MLLALMVALATPESNVRKVCTPSELFGHTVPATLSSVPPNRTLCISSGSIHAPEGHLAGILFVIYREYTCGVDGCRAVFVTKISNGSTQPIYPGRALTVRAHES